MLQDIIISVQLQYWNIPQGWGADAVATNITLPNMPEMCLTFTGIFIQCTIALVHAQS